MKTTRNEQKSRFFFPVLFMTLVLNTSINAYTQPEKEQLHFLDQEVMIKGTSSNISESIFRQKQCEHCGYEIHVHDNQVKLLIDGGDGKLLSFSRHHLNGFMITKQIDRKPQQPSKQYQNLDEEVKQSYFHRQVSKGVIYRYQFIGHGVTIKGQTEMYQWAVFIIAAFFVIFSFLVFPPRLQSIRPVLRRGSLLAVVLNLQTLQIVYYAFIIQFYSRVMNWESTLENILISVFMFCVLIYLFIYDMIFFTIIQKMVYKLPIFNAMKCILTLLLGLWAVVHPIYICYFYKGDNYYAYAFLPVIIQIISSLYYKMIPSARFLAFCVLVFQTLLVLNKFYPAFHFEQITYFTIIVCTEIQLGIIAFGFLIAFILGRRVAQPKDYLPEQSAGSPVKPAALSKQKGPEFAVENISALENTRGNQNQSKSKKHKQQEYSPDGQFKVGDKIETNTHLKTPPPQM